MIRTSASSIKTLNTCSFQFWYQNILRANMFLSPKTTIGEIAHTIFECLAKEKRKGLVNKLLMEKSPNIFLTKLLGRFARTLLKKHKLNMDEWKKDLNFLVINGLKDDFYQEGAIEFFKPEYEFWIKLPTLECRGFIDRAAKYPPNDKYPKGYIVVRDFKSQKEKFTDEELSFNIQASIYAWALFRETELPVIVEFVLLRHGCRQIVDWPGEENLKGIVSYLEYISAYIQDFNLEKAKSNFAADDPNKSWLCAKYVRYQGQLKKNGEEMFCCYARFPKKLYMVLKEGGKEIKYTTDDPSKIKEDDWPNVKELDHGGCPRFHPENYE